MRLRGPGPTAGPFFADEAGLSADPFFADNAAFRRPRAASSDGSSRV